MKFKILIADGFEEIEAVTLIDLLNRVDYEIKSVSINMSKEVTGGHGIKIIADEIMDEADFNEIDGIIIPGGVPGVTNLSSSEKVLNLVKEFNKNKKYIIAICAGPFVLEKAGILNNRKIICYPSWKEMIKTPEILNDNVVVDENIITGEGVGAAIDLGLKIVELFSGKNKSLELRNKIVYRH